MELIEGPVSFVDTRNNRREGRLYLKPVQTVTAGVPLDRPPAAADERSDRAVGRQLIP
jgi:hypothetical protein